MAAIYIVTAEACESKNTSIMRELMRSNIVPSRAAQGPRAFLGCNNFTLTPELCRALTLVGPSRSCTAKLLQRVHRKRGMCILVPRWSILEEVSTPLLHRRLLHAVALPTAIMGATVTDTSQPPSRTVPSAPPKASLDASTTAPQRPLLLLCAGSSPSAAGSSFVLVYSSARLHTTGLIWLGPSTGSPRLQGAAQHHLGGLPMAACVHARRMSDTAFPGVAGAKSGAPGVVVQQEARVLQQPRLLGEVGEVYHQRTGAHGRAVLLAPARQHLRQVLLRARRVEAVHALDTGRSQRECAVKCCPRFPHAARRDGHGVHAQAGSCPAQGARNVVTVVGASHDRTARASSEIRVCVGRSPRMSDELNTKKLMDLRCTL